jgi:hypothetical protein
MFSIVLWSSLVLVPATIRPSIILVESCPSAQPVDNAGCPNSPDQEARKAKTLAIRDSSKPTCRVTARIHAEAHKSLSRGLWEEGFVPHIVKVRFQMVRIHRFIISMKFVWSVLSVERGKKKIKERLRLEHWWPDSEPFSAEATNFGIISKGVKETWLERVDRQSRFWQYTRRPFPIKRWSEWWFQV